MIFLGAGASAPFGIPTSSKLTADIRTLLAKEHQDVLTDIVGFYKRMNDKEPNYEEILTFLMGLTQPRRIPRDSHVRAFVKDFPQHKGDYGKVVDKMYSRLTKYCTSPFVSGEKYLSPDTLEHVFQHTYDLFSIFWNETVFTTNYDPSIEIWCQKRNIALLDNTRSTRNPEIKEVLHIDENSLKESRTNLNVDYYSRETGTLKIVRLHGSIWTFETGEKKMVKLNRPSDKLLFTDLYSHLSERPHIIFPGQESILATGEWDASYQHFKRELRGSCLVIGYSFQDELINRVFLDNLKSKRLKIGVVSPRSEEAVQNLFWGVDIPPKLVVDIPAEFGTAECFDLIRERWLNTARSRTLSHSKFYQALAAFRKSTMRYVD